MIKKGIIKAYIFAEEKHKGQKRKFSDLDYFVHCKMVARRLEELTGNQIFVIAGLLHDTLEDTNTTFEELVEEFGYEVAHLVLELTSDKEEIKKLSKKVYLKNKLDNMSYEALIIKLADREHNIKFLIEDSDLSSIEAMRFLKKYYEETKYIIQDLNFHKGSYQYELISSIESILNKMEKILNIPEGMYCSGCSFYGYKTRNGIKVSYCDFLKKGSVFDLSDEEKEIFIKGLGEENLKKYYDLDLLWDGVKECDINMHEEIY